MVGSTWDRRGFLFSKAESRVKLTRRGKVKDAYVCCGEPKVEGIHD